MFEIHHTGYIVHNIQNAVEAMKLLNYKIVQDIIVINKKTLTPLVWVFDNTQTKGDIILKDGTVLRDPFTIGEELNNYLVNKSIVPNGIDLIKPNKLEDWIL